MYSPFYSPLTWHLLLLFKNRTCLYFCVQLNVTRKINYINVTNLIAGINLYYGVYPKNNGTLFFIFVIQLTLLSSSKYHSHTFLMGVFTSKNSPEELLLKCPARSPKNVSKWLSALVLFREKKRWQGTRFGEWRGWKIPFIWFAVQNKRIDEAEWLSA